MHTPIKITCAVGVGLAFVLGSLANGQSAEDAVEMHRAAAVAAAGAGYQRMLNVICPPEPRPSPPAQNPPAPAGPRANPAREDWYAPPAKVFDNLYFVGTQANGAWAVTTSDGIIVIDGLFDYAVRDEIEGGLRTLGFDPADIKYVVLTHGHDDHAGGARYLQETFSPRIVMGEGDWDLLQSSTRSPHPRRDVVATDGQKLTLGDTTLTLYLTPGHSPSTISFLLPVQDGGQAHMAMMWGGVSLNPVSTPIAQLRAYPDSAARFEQIVAQAGADVIITNHTAHDKTFDKIAALERRRPADPHPFVRSVEEIKGYMVGARECGLATLAAAGASDIVN